MTDHATFEPDPSRVTEAFAGLVDIIAVLRGENGCPWDRQQTPESLKRFVLEEAYEVCDAIDSGQPEHVREELGDLLLQVVLQAQIAREHGRFDLADVVSGIAEKLVRRHPWVFGDVEVESPERALENWEDIKQTEKSRRPESSSLLDQLPAALPALMKAHGVQSKAAHVGFDWDRPEQAFAKIVEESEEVRESLHADPAKLTEEIGDLLFAVVNVARLAGVDAEQALTAASRKFADRFAEIERMAQRQGKSLGEMTLEEMDALWDAHKAASQKDHAP